MAPLLVGCAASIGGAATPTLDSKGNLGHEERLAGEVAIGDPELRASATLGGGAGYFFGEHTAYGLISYQWGIEGGRERVWAVDAGWAGRFLAEEHAHVSHAFATDAKLLWSVRELGGEKSRLLLGPRIFAEYLAGPAGGPDRGLFGIGLELRYVAFDTTGNRWF